MGKKKSLDKCKHGVMKNTMYSCASCLFGSKYGSKYSIKRNYQKRSE